MGYIYRITNLINGKIYIGKCSKTVDKSKSYFGSGQTIKDSIIKYGKENFIKDILIECENEQLNFFERSFIDNFNSKNPEIGYNRSNGYEFTEFFQHSKETKKYLSKINKGRIPSNKGKPMPEWQKEFNRNFNLGKKQSQETIDKRVSKVKGQKRPNMKTNKNTMWINDGTKNKLHNKTTPIPENFIIGRIKYSYPKNRKSKK